jgi:hypothetical protein
LNDAGPSQLRLPLLASGGLHNKLNMSSTWQARHGHSSKTATQQEVNRQAQHVSSSLTMNSS